MSRTQNIKYHLKKTFFFMYFNFFLDYSIKTTRRVLHFSYVSYNIQETFIHKHFFNHHTNRYIPIIIIVIIIIISYLTQPSYDSPDVVISFNMPGYNNTIYIFLLKEMYTIPTPFFIRLVTSLL